MTPASRVPTFKKIVRIRICRILGLSGIESGYAENGNNPGQIPSPEPDSDDSPSTSNTTLPGSSRGSGQHGQPSVGFHASLAIALGRSIPRHGIDQYGGCHHRSARVASPQPQSQPVRLRRACPPLAGIQGPGKWGRARRSARGSLGLNIATHAPAVAPTA